MTLRLSVMVYDYATHIPRWVVLVGAAYCVACLVLASFGVVTVA